MLLGGAAIAAVAVLVIVMRRRAAAAAAASGSSSFDLPASLSSTEGAAADSPASLGLVIPGGGGVVSGQSMPDSSPLVAQSFAAPDSEPATPAVDPITEALLAQGIVLAPPGTTVYDQATGTSYDVSGVPEFGPANFNPNSPAGVLAMNKATGPVSAPVTIPGTALSSSAPADIYSSDNDAAAHPYTTPGGLKYY